MNGKILTLIIPSFNMEKFLDRCLHSLVIDSERMNLFEALIINDGSRDKTSEIGHGYESNYPQTFRVIDKTNGHYGSCINRGLKEAKGKFVKILDADDALDTEVFKQFLDFCLTADITESVDAILSDFIAVNYLTGEKINYAYNQYELPVSPNDILPSDTYEWFIHGLTYRTSILIENNYSQTERVAYTDNEWAFIPMCFVKRIVKFDGSLYLYSIGVDGQSVSDAVHAKNLWMETGIIQNLISYFSKNSLSVHPNAAFLGRRLEIVLTHIYQLYLVTYKQYKINTDPLKELDVHLKSELPRLYSKIEDYSTRIGGITFHPIRNWRKNDKILMSLQSLLYCLADKIARRRTR